MAGIMGKWPSRHGQLTKIMLTAEEKSLQGRRNFGMIAKDLKAIWEMSVRAAVGSSPLAAMVLTGMNTGLGWSAFRGEADGDQRPSERPLVARSRQ